MILRGKICKFHFRRKRLYKLLVSYFLNQEIKIQTMAEVNTAKKAPIKGQAQIQIHPRVMMLKILKITNIAGIVTKKMQLSINDIKIKQSLESIE